MQLAAAQLEEVREHIIHLIPCILCLGLLTVWSYACLPLQEHKKQMSEAVENLNAVHEAHKREITQLHSTANQQCELVAHLLDLSNALLLSLSLLL